MARRCRKRVPPLTKFRHTTITGRSRRKRWLWPKVLRGHNRRLTFSSTPRRLPSRCKARGRRGKAVPATRSQSGLAPRSKPPTATGFLRHHNGGTHDPYYAQRVGKFEVQNDRAPPIPALSRRQRAGRRDAVGHSCLGARQCDRRQDRVRESMRVLPLDRARQARLWSIFGRCPGPPIRHPAGLHLHARHDKCAPDLGCQDAR